ncbi:MAG TPA: SMP-30/gluconolactonase/LRE family protein, partial [Solirubrobacteraceae bacterium]
QGGVVVTGRDISHGDRIVFPAPEGVAGFNDLTTDDEGAVLAGALRFNPMQGEEPRPGEIWRIAPDGSAAIVLDGVVWANGLGLAPGADVLYVNDFAGDRVLACDPDGGSRRTFATVPRGNPDGLAVDEEGGVWVALGGGAAIVRFSAEGTLDALLDVPAAFVASVAFDGDDLLVATAGALLRTPAGVRGRPVAAARV